MMCEQTTPKQPERDVALAGQTGFDFAVISDHFFLTSCDTSCDWRPIVFLWLEAHRRWALAACRIAS